MLVDVLALSLVLEEDFSAFPIGMVLATALCRLSVLRCVLSVPTAEGFSPGGMVKFIECLFLLLCRWLFGCILILLMECVMCFEIC